MTLSDLASVGSLVSGFAVLISLVYLSLQVRQSDKNQRALMNQGYITRTTSILTQGSVNDEVWRVIAGETDFSADELNRLAMTLRVALLNFQDVHTQFNAGLIDRITFDNSLGAIKGYFLSQAVFRALWIDARFSYAPELASFIDGLITEIPLAKPVDIVEKFKTNLALVTA